MADPARYDECGYAPPRLTSDETRLAESYIHQLELEIDRLTAENAKLRALVREAFIDGCENFGGRPFDPHEEWLESLSRQALDALTDKPQEVSGDGANEV